MTAGGSGCTIGSKEGQASSLSSPDVAEACRSQHLINAEEALIPQELQSQEDTSAADDGEEVTQKDDPPLLQLVDDQSLLPVVVPPQRPLQAFTEMYCRSSIFLMLAELQRLHHSNNLDGLKVFATM